VKITLYVLIYFPYSGRREHSIIVAGWLSVCSTVVTLEPTSGMLWNFYARHATRRQYIFMFLFCTTLAP